MPFRSPASSPCRWCRRPCCSNWRRLCGASWDKRAYAEFGAALGAGTLVRTASSFGVRQLVKLIPIYGQTAGAAAAAAASFAATYAMGKAAIYFLMRRRQGRRTAEVASVYRDALQQAFGLAKVREVGAGSERRTHVTKPTRDARVPARIPRVALLVVALLLPDREP